MWFPKCRHPENCSVCVASSRPHLCNPSIWKLSSNNLPVPKIKGTRIRLFFHLSRESILSHMESLCILDELPIQCMKQLSWLSALISPESPREAKKIPWCNKHWGKITKTSSCTQKTVTDSERILQSDQIVQHHEILVLSKKSGTRKRTTEWRAERRRNWADFANNFWEFTKRWVERDT